MRRSLSRFYPLFAGFGLVFLSWTVIAQPVADDQSEQVEQAPVDAERDAVTLNVVSVTADAGQGYQSKIVQVGAFRDQTALDTPSTINVFTRDLMEAQNASDVFDVLKNSAGITRSQTNGMFADNLTIRGMTVQNRSNFRLNGALPINNLMGVPMENKERVEVLKGSSALYYGFTSPGGVINLVTKRAGATPNLTGQVKWNEYGQLVGSIDVGSRFGPDQAFGLRFNAAGGDLGDYGIDVVEGSRSFYSFSADWVASDRVAFYLDYEDARRSVNEQAIIAVPAAVNGQIPMPRRPSSSSYLSAGRWAVTKGVMRNLLGKVVFNLSDSWLATVEAGKATTDRTDRGLGIFRFTNIATGDGTLSMSMNQGERYVNDNVRAEITGLVQTGPVTHEIAFGVMQNKRYQNSARGDTSNVYPQNLYAPELHDRLNPFTRPAVGFRPQNARDNGTYLMDRMRFGEAWQVILGARYADYKNVSELSPTETTRYATTKTSPSASVVYQWHPDTSVYASYIEGLEEGETAPTLGVTNPGEVFGPKVSKQKEIGIKTEAFTGITATLALFEISVPTPGFRRPTATPGLDLYVQEGESRYRGLEANIVGELTPELSIALSAMDMNATQRTAGVAAQIGKTPDSTVERTFGAFLDYRPSWAPGFGVDVGSFYVGQRPLGPMEQGFIAGYTTHVLGARYAVDLAEGRKLSFQLNIDNVTGKKYWAGGNSYLAVGAPRTASLVARFDFF